MKIEGKAVKLGDNINTDLIISGRYKFSITNMKELSQHLFEDLDCEFHKKIIPGKTILIGASNFGMGSSREQAPLVIREAGIRAVVAKNFARIFYRNGFNIGLPLLEADTDNIDDGDEISIDLDKGTIENKTRAKKINSHPIPDVMQTLLKDGGLVAHVKKYKTLNF